MSNCTKPHCNCAEIEMDKQGTELIKSYPCLKADTSPECEKVATPSMETKESGGQESFNIIPTPPYIVNVYANANYTPFTKEWNILREGYLTGWADFQKTGHFTSRQQTTTLQAEIGLLESDKLLLIGQRDTALKESESAWMELEETAAKNRDLQAEINRLKKSLSDMQFGSNAYNSGYNQASEDKEAEIEELKADREKLKGALQSVLGGILTTDYTDRLEQHQIINIIKKALD